MNFNGDIIITDPCYLMKSDDDWELSNYGINLENIGIKTFLTDINADCFPPDIFDANSNIKLGEFASDSGAISIIDLSEAKNYNANFPKDLEKNCYTIIKNFIGEVTIIDIDDGNFHTLAFSGIGNINFSTTSI